MEGKERKEGREKRKRGKKEAKKERVNAIYYATELLCHVDTMPINFFENHVLVFSIAN